MMNNHLKPFDLMVPNDLELKERYLSSLLHFVVNKYIGSIDKELPTIRFSVPIDDSIVHNPRVQVPAAAYDATDNLILIHPYIAHRFNLVELDKFIDEHSKTTFYNRYRYECTFRMLRYIPEYLMYHELLHAIHPPVNGEPHHPEFMKAELKFTKRKPAIAWLSHLNFPTL